GVIEPAPAPPGRVAGRFLRGFARRADSLCRASIAEAARARWRQYREIWAYVEEGGCRRGRILRHFGDHAEPHPSGPCCDACDDAHVPTWPPRRPPPAPAAPARLPKRRVNALSIGEDKTSDNQAS